MRLKDLFVFTTILGLAYANRYSRVNLGLDQLEEGFSDSVFFFIQDICGTDEQLKDSAQSVYSNYMPLLKRGDVIYLGTNNPAQSEVHLIEEVDQLDLAMRYNRQHANMGCIPSIGETLDFFYLKLKERTSKMMINDLADRLLSKVNVAHVTTVSVDINTGNYLHKLASDYNLKMEFIGITKKNEYFKNSNSFDIFPGTFTQTYDTEVALLDLVSAFGSHVQPGIPSSVNLPRCIQNLQADFTFHTDISSVPRMDEFRSKASKIVQSVVKYFDIPKVKNIDMDDDTCEFNKAQLEDKTQFYGVIYANSSGIGVPTFCMSNMNSYPDTIAKADVIDSFTKWYSNPTKMMCHCFDYENEKTTKIIMWIPLSPTSLDTDTVSFAGFDVVGFKHIVVPFGFSYDDSPLWQSLIPDRSQWLTDASRYNYDIEQIIQDIWTITCRFAEHIEMDQTAEPFNPYTIAKPASEFPRHFLFIQDVCGADENLKDQAQQVYANYLPLLSNDDNFYLGTNDADVPGIKTISSIEEFKEALSENRHASTTCTTSSIGAMLDLFYLKIKHQTSANTFVLLWGKDKIDNFSKNGDSDKKIGSVNVAHVTTISVDNNVGTYLNKLASEYILKMEFVGLTKKHDYFQNPEAFDNFPGNFTQTYDPEVALLDLVNALGSLIKPVIPPVDNLPRCIKNLQAYFTFHTDISSVPRMDEFRAKATMIVQSVTNYFDIPGVKNIDMDDDTCEFNKAQLEDKTQFYGVIYANSSGIGVPTFCMSNMNSYPDTIAKADVIDSFTKWYSNPTKMMCHCFDDKNDKTTKIIMWIPLSPTSLDTGAVSFAGFDVVGFKHIVVPFGFSYDESPLWQSLVPNREQWTGDASLDNYDVDQIIQDIWTITCRFAGHLEGDQTAEPVNPYTTVKPRIN